MKLKQLLFSVLLGSAAFTNFGQDSTALSTQEVLDIHVTAPMGPELEVLSYTLETWVFIHPSVPAPTGQSTDELFFIESYTNSSNGGFALRRSTQGKIRAWVFGSAGQITMAGGSDIPQGMWVHVAATYDENEDSIKVFLNGVQDGSQFLASDALPYPASPVVKVGARGDDSDMNYAFMLDEVRIWNYAKTENEISSDMNNCLVGNETGLVLYYTFEDITGATVSDGTSYGNDGTIQNNDMTALNDGVFDCCNVDNSISASGATLTAGHAGGSYQWIDCNTFASISGATSQSYTATVDGDYAVIVDDGICVDTSACITVAGVGVEELNSFEFNIFPNPAYNELNISVSASLIGARIYSISGQLLLQTKENQIDIRSLEAGTYILLAETDKGILRQRFIKQ